MQVHAVSDLVLSPRIIHFPKLSTFPQLHLHRIVVHQKPLVDHMPYKTTSSANANVGWSDKGLLSVWEGIDGRKNTGTEILEKV